MYLSFLVKVDSASTGDYFIGLSPSGAQTNYYARIFVKSSAPGYVIGLSKSNETPQTYGSTALTLHTTYLVVVKYKFNTSSTLDDAISLFVFSDPTLPSTEPGSPEVGPYSNSTKNDAVNLGFVTLRQGSAASAPILTIDGIRIGKTWEGTVLAHPVSALSKTVMTFGNVQVGSAKSDTVTIYNNGASSLNITGITSSDPTFVVLPSSGSIAPLDSLKFDVTYTLSTTGNNSSLIVFTNNTAKVKDTINAAGAGVQAGFSATPGSLTFGNVFKDSTKTDTITVSNPSNAVKLVIDSVRIDNALFSVSPTSGTVDTSSSMTFAVTFAPVAAGAQNTSVVFFHNAPSLHDTVRAHGTGILREGIFNASKSSIAFPHIMLGTSKTDSVLVKNAGYDSLLIISVTSTSSEFVVTPTDARLDTGASHMSLVTYTPVDTAHVSASLIFHAQWIKVR